MQIPLNGNISANNGLLGIEFSFLVCFVLGYVLVSIDSNDLYIGLYHLLVMKGRPKAGPTEFLSAPAMRKLICSYLVVALG